MEGAGAFSAMLAAVEARCGAAPGSAARRHTRAALEAYCRIGAGAEEPAARGFMAALVPQVLQDASAMRAAARDDPAAPDLDRWYGALLAELGDLTAVFASEPAGGDSALYRGLCEELRACTAAGEQARPVWDVLRRSRAEYAASRARPPPRERAPPPADDAEYYAG